jgi:hypothetical protein
MSYPPLQLAAFALKGWQEWYMKYAQCQYVFYGDNGFVAFGSFTDCNEIEPTIQAQIDHDLHWGLAVMIWQAVWIPSERRRIHILVYQTQPIHPLTMEMIADAFAEQTEYNTGFYGWHPMGHIYED